MWRVVWKGKLPHRAAQKRLQKKALEPPKGAYLVSEVITEKEGALGGGNWQ